jgi:hypothetical protein
MMTKNTKTSLRTPPLSTGGAKKTRFAALDSDSEEEHAATPPPTPAANIFQIDSIYLAMCEGSILWGDLLIPVESTAAPAAPPLELPPARALCGEEEFWAQPWAHSVECHWSDCYDTSAASEDDWIAMMTWLYSVGWDVTSESRNCVRAYPDNQPARVWVAPNRFALAAQKDDGPGYISCSNHTHKPAPVLAAPGSDKGKRKGTPIPRFCKAATACQEAGCRYIHGDTIPRVNQPCSFGESCGASDPTGVKRSQCLHMHPGETWTEGMVITRPAPTN